MTIKLAIAVLAGGVAAQHSRVLISWDQCLPIMVALGVLIYVRSMRLLAAFAAGFLLLHMTASRIVADRIDMTFAGDSMLVVVRVIEFPDVRNSTTSLIIAPVDDKRLPARSRVSWFNAPVKPAIGDIWQLELRLRRPRSAANPGGFDAERWMFRERIHAMGYVVPGTRNRLLRSPDLGPVERIRSEFVSQSRVVPDARGVIAAVAVGVREGISRAQWQRYAETGTSHLVAISGLHVGLAALAAFGVVYVFSVVLQPAANHYRHATVGGVLLAFAYVLVSGSGIPAQRAALMLGLAALAVVARRQVRPAHVLATCALAVFCIDPVASMAPGFALSFGAVVLLYRAAANFRSGKDWSKYLAGLWSAQLILFFGLLPFTVLFFDRIALVAPAVNFVLVPLFSLLTVPASLAAIVAVAFDLSLAESCLRLAAVGVRVVEFVVGSAAQFPVDGSTYSRREGLLVAMPWLALLWVLLPRSWPGRSLAPLTIISLLLIDSRTPPQGCFDMHVLDVGQGQSIVIRTARHTLVYDTGPAHRSGSSSAQQVLLPFLEYIGVRHIDWLVVSHGDLDHAGGVRHLVGGVAISRAFLSEPMAVADLNAFTCRSGQMWRADGVIFRVLHPDASAAYEGNNSSCVVEVAAREHRVLLTGDIESEAELGLLKRGVLRRSLVATVPHHGSETSSQPAFVNRIRPNIVVASTSYKNRWNLPSERVRRRWEGVGARFYDTGTSGATSLRVCAWRSPRQVREERNERWRFWHDPGPPQ